VGSEVVCSVKIGRRSARGKALLETNEIIFRSPELRLKIPLNAIEKLDAKDGALSVTYADSTATFGLGPVAARWAERIRNPKSLIDKLGVKPEHRVVVLGVKDAGFLATLGKLAKLRDAIKRDGMIWAVTPKGKGGLKDTGVLAAGKAAGLVDVKVAAFSETHTASKFVIPKAMR
jgi:hypothetical protein